MRRVIIIGLIVVYAGGTESATGAMTRGQAEKLVAAVWKEAPESIDITYYATMKVAAKDRDAIRRSYEEAHEQMYGPKEELNAYMLKRREQFVRMNVERFVVQQQSGRRSKVGNGLWRLAVEQA